MSAISIPPADVGAVLAALRSDLGVTQSQVAREAAVDQSRISRIEKGEIAPPIEIKQLISALERLGSSGAEEYRAYLEKEWVAIERPAFMNPQRDALELADDMLQEIQAFLDEERPWPLRRQIERQRDSLLGSVSYLQSLSHEIAFIGDIGVGKSTAISVIFDLLAQADPALPPIDRVVLETGGGRTTVCEVTLKRGPEYGLIVQPQSSQEVSNLVSDFAASIWQRVYGEPAAGSEDAVQVSEEMGRALRNMAGLTVKREKQADGRRLSRDLAMELAQDCATEEEFRTRIIERIHLERRTRREVWHEPTPGKSALQWLAETFKEVNNGRVDDVTIPRSIDLLLPTFGSDFAPMSISVVDTKGVDDVAVRPDLDARLKDPRTLAVLCTSFNDAPSTTVRLLLDHLRDSLAERIDSGKIALLVLPRPGEALKVKDDSGAVAEDDADGYDMKREQIERTLGSAEQELGGAPVIFFNSAQDQAAHVREALVGQINRMRGAYSERILDIAATVDDLIKNHEAQAVTAAVEEVADRLRYFLDANRGLRPRERHAYDEVLIRLRSIRYASTLWAATRRNGEWNNFHVSHHIGVGAAQDALLRSKEWFTRLNGLLSSMKADPDLALARRLIDQIEQNGESWRKSFAEAARVGGSEVYREHIQQDGVLWTNCAREWGRGQGFKYRVEDHLKDWFEKRTDLKDGLENVLNHLWEETVIRQVERLCNETSPAPDEDAVGNVISFAHR